MADLFDLGLRLGHGKLIDSTIHDGLWDPYNDMHMGMCGEKCAADFNFSRGAQDEYARESTLRAQKAQAAGAFKAEIAPVEIVDKKGSKTVVEEDEGPKLARPDKIASLKPAFKKDGTVTAANASSINDGAAERKRGYPAYPPSGARVFLVRGADQGFPDHLCAGSLRGSGRWASRGVLPVRSLFVLFV